MDRKSPHDRQLRRSVSPRSESRYRRTSRSPVSEGRSGDRNGNRAASRSRSRTRSTSRSRGRSRSRSWSRSYRSRSYSRSQSPSNTARSSKIVVEKLTKNVTEPHLFEIFGSFGEIQSVDIPMNHAFMTNRGTAYILYHDPADAEAAISHMHEAQLDGAVLNVSIVLPKLAFSRSPPPVLNARGNYGRQRHPAGRTLDNLHSRHSPHHKRASPPRRYGRSRPSERHDIYRPRSLSRSRSPRRSRSFSSRSPSVSRARRRGRTQNASPRRDKRRSPSYSSYDYSSRSRSRSRSRDRGRNQRGPLRR